MSIHPRVVSLCPARQNKTFTTLEEFFQFLVAVTEAWLGDDKWIPEFFYASKGAGSPIVGDFLPDFKSSTDLVRILAPTVTANQFSQAGVLLPCRSRVPGQPPPTSPNYFLTAVFDRTGRSLTKAWEVRVKADGKVIKWQPSGQSVPLGFNASAIFDTASLN